MQVPRSIVVLVLVLIVGLMGLSTWSFVSKNNAEFERRQECSKYVPTIKKKFDEAAFMAPDLSSWSSNELLEMFYSKSRSSCLFTWVRTIASDASVTMIYNLNDALSGEALISGEALNSVKPDFTQNRQAFFDAVTRFR